MGILSQRLGSLEQAKREERNADDRHRLLDENRRLREQLAAARKMIVTLHGALPWGAFTGATAEDPVVKAAYAARKEEGGASYSRGGKRR